MTIFQAILLSILEGITEFLPVSSTGHLILASDWLGIAPTEFVKSFEIIIQLGAILAVVFLYWETLVTNLKLWPKIVIGFMPSAVVGFLFYPLIKDHLFENTTVVLLSLAIGGLVLVKIDDWLEEGKTGLKDLTVQTAIIIGLFQTVSVVPGVSRAAATIIGGLFLGLNRKSAVEFSFLLAIPTMLAAASLDLAKTSLAFSQSELVVLTVGFVGSFVTAILTIKFLLGFIKNHSFKIFGVYRLVLAGALGVQSPI